ncbi:hypothetical protein VZT92_017689 [Zoarces viviparus]|uniref:Reverse transcriptase domain-containing protein n=1 Tax=Zoarces viviparus TaxID=48416 RepID=A0AAW1EN45_ZOAVI
MTSITDPAKSLALNQELAALLVKGAIERVDPLSQPGGFYSTYFLVKKRGGGLRPILDLRGLNKFLKVLPFHMLTTADVLRAVSRGDWFTSVDLKDAYFHCTSPQAVSSLRLSRRSLPVQGAPIRTLPLPTGVHKVRCCCPFLPAITGHENTAVLGRLADVRHPSFRRHRTLLAFSLTRPGRASG